LVVDAMLDPAAEISALWNLWDHAEPTDIAALDVVDERPAPTGGVLLEPYAPESLLYLVVHDRAPTKDAGDALGLLLIRAGFP
ncbi:MAG: hypothetical protein K8I02_13090, partial [Candidatus Methylomirabilis sp.]|nr:hypothetical protein [Deltaproteobacteria bacterium]